MLSSHQVIHTHVNERRAFRNNDRKICSRGVKRLMHTHTTGRFEWFFPTGQPWINVLMDAWTNSLLLLRRYRYLLAYFLQHVEAYVNIIHIYRKTIYYNTALCSLIYSKRKKRKRRAVTRGEWTWRNYVYSVRDENVLIPSGRICFPTVITTYYFNYCWTSIIMEIFTVVITSHSVALLWFISSGIRVKWKERTVNYFSKCLKFGLHKILRNEVKIFRFCEKKKTKMVFKTW